MKTKVFAVRHGETDWNIKKCVQGRADRPLTKKGESDALKLAKDFKEKNIDLIFSSQLKRSRKTAEIIGKVLGKEIQSTNALNERDFGSLTGKTWEEIGEIDPKLSELDRKQQFNYRPFGGESVEDVRKRIDEFLEFLEKKYPGKNILLITHGGIIRLLKHLHHGELLAPYEIDNIGVYIFNL